MLGWDRYRFNKKHVGTCYAELLFFHPLRSVGHVVHSVAPGARNIDALLFMLVGPIRIQQKACRDTLR
jgi:hypothetical protein